MTKIHQVASWHHGNSVLTRIDRIGTRPVPGGSQASKVASPETPASCEHDSGPEDRPTGVTSGPLLQSRMTPKHSSIKHGCKAHK